MPSAAPVDDAGESGTEPTALGHMLAGIGEEVSRKAAALRDQVQSSFGARMQLARQTAPPHELAARIAGLKAEMRAALKAIAINAELERRGRQQAAMRDRGGGRQRARPARPSPGRRVGSRGPD